MQKTNIEFLDMTWNPIVMRCTPVSAGCDNCWHLPFTRRHSANSRLCDDARAAYAGGAPWMNVKELSAPLRRRPAVIGVQFMGDMFHESVMYDQVAAVFGAMAACPQHIFVVLTKRPELAMAWFEWLKQFSIFDETSPGIECAYALLTIAEPYGDGPIHCKYGPAPDVQFPLKNVWIGVSVENDKHLGRIDTLRQIPAANRVVSFEPLLGPIAPCLNNIDWVIAGAETGPGKRVCRDWWGTQLRDCCRDYGVPFFWKKDRDGKPRVSGGLR